MGKEWISIVVEVPDSQYCAKFGDWGLTEVCPLLKQCQTSKRAYYCPIANSDTHCGQDSVGILKQDDYYSSICPSLFEKKIMDQIRQIRVLEDKLRGQSGEVQ
jgi:hypothetical protein